MSNHPEIEIDEKTCYLTWWVYGMQISAQKDTVNDK